MLLTVPIFCVRACIKFYGRIWRWRRCVRSEFWKCWCQERRKNASLLQKHFWTIAWQIGRFLDGSSRAMSRGFSNMVRPQCVSQCSGRGETSHGTKKLAWLGPSRNVNFIFQRPRLGYGGMGAVLEKCRCCFPYQNTLDNENLYQKEEAAVVGGEPFHVPPRQCSQPPSWFNAKVPGEEQYVVNASSSIFPTFSALQFFYFPEVEIGAEGAASGGFGGNKIENGRLPAEYSQIWLQTGPSSYNSWVWTKQRYPKVRNETWSRTFWINCLQSPWQSVTNLELKREFPELPCSKTY